MKDCKGSEWDEAVRALSGLSDFGMLKSRLTEQ